jgi:hypothetical protein
VCSRIGATLFEADLSGATLFEADLIGATLIEAELSGANLEAALLLLTDFSGADLTGCRIYGVSAWRLKLDGAKQQNLVITRWDQPIITVDNIDVAQFIWMTQAPPLRRTGLFLPANRARIHEGCSTSSPFVDGSPLAR